MAVLGSWFGRLPGGILGRNNEILTTICSHSKITQYEKITTKPIADSFNK